MEAIRSEPDTFNLLLDDIPAPIYLAADDGTVTYANPACAELVGREPEIGQDKWCVSARLYTLDGEELPHEECPMAIAVTERRPVRDVEAIGERPDGSRFQFVPYATPVFTAEGEFAGAINLLLDVTEQRQPEFLRSRAKHCRHLAAKVADPATAETLSKMADKYDEQSRK